MLLQLSLFQYGYSQMPLKEFKDELFAIDDHSEGDGDGNVCEAKIT
ncbi:MAG: hypothetical protein AAGA77_11065 [Bacteroidota bacterium]